MSAVDQSKACELPELPELPHHRLIESGIPWLTFDGNLESEFRRAHFERNLLHIRINLGLALTLTLAICAVETVVLGPDLERIPSLIHLLLVVPVLLVCMAVTFSGDGYRLYRPLAVGAGLVLGLGALAVNAIASASGVYMLFPCLVLATVFVYFMGGVMFYEALAVNVLVMLVYLIAGILLTLESRHFGYDAMILLAANSFCAASLYMHEKTDRLRFLDTAVLREIAARDGLTGISNRRAFDQHIEQVWQQAVRQTTRVAVLMVDIDCFKGYNDRYGHQAGDECLRAVAISLSQCARRPLDFVARYGGEEFSVVLYEASREYVAEVLTRIQRSIAELNIPNESSPVATRLTVSIGAAYVLPGASRTHDGLVQLADEALYSAKEQGRNRVVVMEAEYQNLRTGRFEKRRASS